MTWGLQFAGGGKWRDNAGVDGPLMRAVFPYASIEESDHWEDLLKLDVTVVFDRAMIINRDTAHRQYVCPSNLKSMLTILLKLLWRPLVQNDSWYDERDSSRRVLGTCP